MAVRTGTVADIKDILEFLDEYHRTDSNLSDIPFDRKSMTKTIEYFLYTSKQKIFVYEKEGKICGVLLAGLEPFVFNENRYWATDTVFVARAGGTWLLKHFIRWAQAYKVDRIIMGISTEDERAGALYEACGLVKLGGMYYYPLGD